MVSSWKYIFMLCTIVLELVYFIKRLGEIVLSSSVEIVMIL